MSLLDNPEQLRQRLVWDAFPHAHARRVLAAIGKVPPSDDGAEMECRESHERLLRVTPVAEEISAMADMMAEALVRTILGEAADSLGPKFVASLVDSYRNVFRTGAVVSLANLMDAGVIEYTESTS